MQLVGIDLGGTKIEGVVTDSADLSRPLCRLRLSTEADQGYEHILRQIAKLHGLLAEEVGGKLPAVVGIGTPGSLEQCCRFQKRIDGPRHLVGVNVLRKMTGGDKCLCDLHGWAA